MKKGIDRREFMKFVGIGGIVFISGMDSFAFADGKKDSQDDFFFVQLSDTHWGFSDAKVNPDYSGTLKKAIIAANSLEQRPDFVIFTGDLSHTTEDPKLRRTRMAEVKTIIGDLKVKDIKFMPGEHDAGLDAGEAFREYFGKTHYTFDHKGVHFIVLDNVSDPTSSLGDAQLEWLAADLKKLDKDARIVVFTHRPLFDLYPQWDWWTRDGAKAVDLLMPFTNVVVFYGHIHQENHHMTGHIPHHAAKGLMFPLPEPASQPKRQPLPWDPTAPYKGLGFREVEADVQAAGYKISEYPVVQAAQQAEQVIKITAKRFEYNPSEIRLKKGIPTVLELTSLDRLHGFNCPDLGIRGDINPDKPARISLVPQRAGTFVFFCDIFCGDGHENMNGKLIIEE